MESGKYYLGEKAELPKDTTLGKPGFFYPGSINAKEGGNAHVFFNYGRSGAAKERA